MAAKEWMRESTDEVPQHLTRGSPQQQVQTNFNKPPLFRATVLRETQSAHWRRQGQAQRHHQQLSRRDTMDGAMHLSLPAIDARRDPSVSMSDAAGRPISADTLTLGFNRALCSSLQLTPNDVSLLTSAHPAIAPLVARAAAADSTRARLDSIVADQGAELAELRSVEARAAAKYATLEKEQAALRLAQGIQFG